MKKQVALPPIVLGESGFQFEGDAAWHVKWSAVHRITAHKLDLLTTDEIRLVLEIDSSPLSVEVSEEQPGFDKFKSFVEAHFSFPPGWLEVLMKPAFSANETVLYARAEQSIPADRAKTRSG